jgi:hypothetical protein
MTINIETLRPIPAATEAEIAGIRNRLDTQRPSFIADASYLAVLAFGGTVQSAYVPSEENIMPVAMNPAFERTYELAERFGVASRELTGAILVAKDSRLLENADVISLVHSIEQMPNTRIVVSCGTYFLPVIAQILDEHFGNGKSDKIIGVFGSWLPLSIEGQDADFNIGGTIAAVNALAKTNHKGIVFAQFHGEMFFGEELVKLNLHPPGINPRFGRPTVDIR